jgi:hypothetical protein
MTTSFSGLVPVQLMHRVEKPGELPWEEPVYRVRVIRNQGNYKRNELHTNTGLWLVNIVNDSFYPTLRCADLSLYLKEIENGEE